MQSVEQLIARIEDLKARGKAVGKAATSVIPSAAGASTQRRAACRRGALVSYSGGFGSMDELKAWAKEVRGSLKSGVIAAGLDEPDDGQLFVTVSDDLIEQGVDAAELVRDALPRSGGKGGGQARHGPGQAAGPRAALQAALQKLRERLQG